MFESTSPEFIVAMYSFNNAKNTMSNIISGGLTGLHASSRKGCSVFVGNIPYDVDEDQLRQVFSAVGQVASLRLMYDKLTRQPKGYGFCEYYDQETAYKAMRNLNNVEVNGRPLRVDWADHELRNSDGSKSGGVTASGRGMAEPTLKKRKIANQVLQEYVDRLAPDHVPDEAAANAALMCDVSTLIGDWPSSLLFDALQNMQQLVQSSPDLARRIFSGCPAAAMAMLQIMYLLGFVSDPSLPMSNEDREFANDRIAELRAAGIVPAKPFPLPKRAGASSVDTGVSSGGPMTAMPAMVGAPMSAIGANSAPVAPTAPGSTSASTSDQKSLSEQEKALLAKQLASLTPEQLSKLPEAVRQKLIQVMKT